MVNDTITLDPIGIPLHYGYGQHIKCFGGFCSREHAIGQSKFQFGSLLMRTAKFLEHLEQCSICVDLQKYFSHLSLVIYLFPTPPINLKLNRWDSKALLGPTTTGRC
jgi:hypothetical protein